MKDGVCLQCSAATFKDAIGNEACQDCHDFSTSPAGSDEASDCKCSAGYTSASALSCEACGLGLYKGDVGDHDCTACPSLKSTTFETATSEADCYCIAGYATNADTSGCVLCPQDTFKDAVGPGDCTECRYGSTSEADAISSDPALCATLDITRTTKPVRVTRVRKQRTRTRGEARRVLLVGRVSTAHLHPPMSASVAARMVSLGCRGRV